MTIIDNTIASIGLPHHRPLVEIADSGQAATDEIRKNGAKAIALARELAANGYPSSTLGDGGSRGSDSTSSTERAAGFGGDVDTPEQHNRWAAVPRRLALALAAHDRAAKDVQHLVASIVQHATDLDRVPVGTGECQACGRFCRPDAKHAGNRLRSGLCPTDYRAWLRDGKPQRSDWVRTRRNDFTDDDGVLHTPEPDHDIDLSSEKLSP